MSSANEKQLAKWQEHVDGLKKSGLSRADYCRQHGIATHQLNYWRRKLSQTSQSRFIPIELPSPSEKKAISGTGARVFLPRGVVIELSQAPDPYLRSTVKGGKRTEIG